MKLVFSGHLEVIPGGNNGRTWYKVIASGKVLSTDGQLVLHLPYYEQYSNVSISSGDHDSLPVRLLSRLDRKQAKHVIELRFD